MLITRTTYYQNNYILFRAAALFISLTWIICCGAVTNSGFACRHFLCNCRQCLLSQVFVCVPTTSDSMAAIRDVCKFSHYCIYLFYIYYRKLLVLCTKNHPKKLPTYNIRDKWLRKLLECKNIHWKTVNDFPA